MKANGRYSLRKIEVYCYLLKFNARELQQYITNKRKNLDLSTPKSELQRQDIRQKIQDITYTEWKKKGLSKGTLHYLKKNAKQNKPFTINKHIKEKLYSIF